MLIAFHHSDKQREIDLASAFGAGARAFGHEIEYRRLGGGDIGHCDLAVMVGVKSRDLWRASKQAGVRTLMIDKGYSRHRGEGRVWEYWRISLDAHQPTLTTLEKIALPHDRLADLGWEPRPFEPKPEGSIIIAGSSAKYHSFYGLPDPEIYYPKLARRVVKLSDRPVIYRPKPSYREARPIQGTQFSGGKEHLSVMFESAYCLITHGSNACFDALIYGVPAIVIGDGVTASISARDIDQIGNLPIPTEIARMQLLANLAYHQWTEDEMSSGEMFKTLGEWIDAV